MPLVVSYHSDVVRQRRWLAFYRPMMRWFLDRATRIVAVGDIHCSLHNPAGIGVAVLGSGLDVMYPAEHADLARDLVSGDCFDKR